MACTHVYCGNGKGKTTCAMGLALRAAGTGMSVVIVQFLKNSPSGEITLLENMSGVTVFRGKAGEEFTFTMTDEQKKETRLIHDRNFQKALHLVKSGYCELLVLDEICAAWNGDLLDKKAVEDFLLNKPENLELVLTGRNPPDCMLNIADYITEMKLIKHPFEKGIPAREGIEF